MQPDEAGIRKAAEALRAGGLVSFPTETVYGLGANAEMDTAVAAVFDAKQRPSFNPLISHVANVAAARKLGIFNAVAEKLARAFWPGPLTLVVPVAPGCRVSLLARAGLDTLALRVPAHPVARSLLAACNFPVAAPSANISGAVSPTRAEHVREGLGPRIGAIIDGGACEVGVESTIVSCVDETPVMLRPGGISRAEIEAVINAPLQRVSAQTHDPDNDGGNTPLAPGMLASHYAPRARVLLQAASAGADDAVLDFSGQLSDWAGSVAAYLDLSPSGDLREAAANLFACLRQLDSRGVAQIAVAPVPRDGIGEAINDRLARAAADRD